MALETLFDLSTKIVIFILEVVIEKMGRMEVLLWEPVGDPALGEGYLV